MLSGVIVGRDFTLRVFNQYADEAMRVVRL